MGRAIRLIIWSTEFESEIDLFLFNIKLFYKFSKSQNNAHVTFGSISTAFNLTGNSLNYLTCTKPMAHVSVSRLLCYTSMQTLLLILSAYLEQHDQLSKCAWYFNYTRAASEFVSACGPSHPPRSSDTYHYRTRLSQQLKHFKIIK